MNILNILLIAFNTLFCIALFIGCIAIKYIIINKNRKKKVDNTAELSPRNYWRWKNGGID